MAAPIILQSNPRAGYLARKAEIDAAIANVLSGGWYVMGQEVRAFEAEFAAFVGAEHAMGVGSGTDALEVSLRALGIGPGDAVYTVSHTAVATVAAVERSGATAVLVDVDEGSYTLDPQALEDALRHPPAGARPKAVIAVHLYGHPADMRSILDVANRHSLRVVEDCAQSHGARVADSVTGTLGDLGAYSFYPTKNLGAFGDGGMVVTRDAELAAKVRRLREYGWEPRFISQVPGLNSRLDELHAATLRVGLRDLAANNERRRAIARAYDGALSGSDVRVPSTRSGVEHVYHQYVVRTRDRDAQRALLEKHGVGTAIHYPMPVHLQPAYAGRVTCVGELAVTERIMKDILSLPMHPWLTEAEVLTVIRALEQTRSADSPP